MWWFASIWAALCVVVVAQQLYARPHRWGPILAVSPLALCGFGVPVVVAAVVAVGLVCYFLHVRRRWFLLWATAAAGCVLVGTRLHEVYQWQRAKDANPYESLAGRLPVHLH